MRHNLSGRAFGRSPSHRKATMQSIAVALIKHEMIKTTVPKAKELRRFAEPLIARAKTDSALKRWGTDLREKIGFKRANVAVARKLAVTLFAMLRTGKPFEAEGVPA